jgi:hypothetical protein
MLLMVGFGPFGPSSEDEHKGTVGFDGGKPTTKTTTTATTSSTAEQQQRRTSKP